MSLIAILRTWRFPMVGTCDALPFITNGRDAERKTKELTMGYTDIVCTFSADAGEDADMLAQEWLDAMMCPVYFTFTSVLR